MFLSVKPELKMWGNTIINIVGKLS